MVQFLGKCVVSDHWMVRSKYGAICYLPLEEIPEGWKKTYSEVHEEVFPSFSSISSYFPVSNYYLNFRRAYLSQKSGKSTTHNVRIDTVGSIRWAVIGFKYEALTSTKAPVPDQGLLPRQPKSFYNAVLGENYKIDASKGPVL